MLIHFGSYVYAERFPGMHIWDREHLIATSISELIVNKVSPDLLSSFPILLQFIADVECLNAVSEYIETLRELVDVGIVAKLIIDKVSHPTGLQKT